MSTVKVSDRVKYNKEYGTVSYVDEYSFRVNWDDGDVSTESIDSLSEDGIELLVDNEDWWAKKYGSIEPVDTPLTEKQARQIKQLEEYITAIDKKYPEKDAVNPKHYDLFPEHGIQVRELMQVLCDKINKQGYSGFLCSDYVQAMQYFLRWFEKNGAEDIKKGIWYMNKILEQLKEKE